MHIYIHIYWFQKALKNRRFISIKLDRYRIYKDDNRLRKHKNPNNKNEFILYSVIKYNLNWCRLSSEPKKSSNDGEVKWRQTYTYQIPTITQSNYVVKIARKKEARKIETEHSIHADISQSVKPFKSVNHTLSTPATKSQPTTISKTETWMKPAIVGYCVFFNRIYMTK